MRSRPAMVVVATLALAAGAANRAARTEEGRSAQPVVSRADASADTRADRGDWLRARLGDAPHGSVLVVPAGRYIGPFVVDRPVHLRADGAAHLQGDGHTHTVAVRAADVTIEGFEITDSGMDLSKDHAAVHVTGARAVVIDNRIHDAVIEATPVGGIEFMHGYTYSGHPMAAAAVVATQKLYSEEQTFARAAAIAPYFEDAVHSLRDARHVIDVRNLGLVAGIELAPRAGAPGKRAYEAFVKCFEMGVLVRTTGDIFALSPPLIIEKPHIDQLVSVLRDALGAVE